MKFMKNNPNALAKRRLELVEEIEKIDRLVADYKSVTGFDLFTVGKKGNPGKYVIAARKALEAPESDDQPKRKSKFVRVNKARPGGKGELRKHVPQVCGNLDSCPKPERKFRSKTKRCKYCSRYCRDHYNRLLRIAREKDKAKAAAKAEVKGIPLVKGDPLTAGGFENRGRL